MIFVARIINAILSIVAINFLNMKFTILPAGTAYTLLATAIGVALSEWFFYLFNRRR